MLKLLKESDRIVLSYTGEQTGSEWIYSELNKRDTVTLRKTFTVSEAELISTQNPEDEDAPVNFVIAFREGDYYRFSQDVLGMKNNLYIHKDISLNTKFFIAERNISVFSKLDHISGETIYIGGDKQDSIPETAFLELIKNFPNSYELTRYAHARVSAIISSYLNTKENYEENYQQYMNRKVSKKGEDLQALVAGAEIAKYQTLIRKLASMLDDEVSYSEAQWQEEILQIILILYPKYIHVFKEAPVRDTYSNKDRNIDFLLVDSTGNIDIIEIKKPFDKCIVTQGTYRNNYIPLRELSGTVMQIEKYIFYLNKWGKKGEEKLTNHYQKNLAQGFSIRITNPSGIIIMGREMGFSSEQRQDFEVIKRQYKNVIDIITYDDLIGRLNYTIKKWSKYT
ncbi:MAG: Shedu immune nuclease family protein [Candidatus Cloacimonadota bacterium]|nr:Shedu immune nuclease family protein [Candidatus Cloacimonadota bacterium]